MRQFALAAFLALVALRCDAAERWETLPPTPAPIATDRSGEAEANGIKIHYAIYGQGSPVIFLHGGLANTDYWGNQVPAVAAHHTVILMDSRGHGRSTRDARPYGYDLMADDVVALMDVLKIPKADIVGWSDGGILGIDLAMRHKERVGKVFSFAANTVTSGVVEGVEKNPTFAAYIERAGHEYAEHSATPKEYDAFVDQISKMWADQPNWTDDQLKAIDTPILVVDGDHDEAIKRPHTEYIAATIPHAGLLILPNASISPSFRTRTSSTSPSCISSATNRRARRRTRSAAPATRSKAPGGQSVPSRIPFPSRTSGAISELADGPQAAVY